MKTKTKGSPPREIALGIALAIAGAGSGASAQPVGGRVELPIQQVRLSDGTLRYAIEITVGGQPVVARLDTGSIGLRLLPAAQHGLETTPRPSHEQFGSGVTLDGPIARGQVSIGGRAGVIGVQQVRRIGCVRDGCGASIGLPAFGILGSGLPGEGFKALIGIKPEPGGAPRNPLLQLGVRRWIVSLPVPGASQPGRLVLDPDARDLGGFVPVPAGGRPGTAYACLYRPTPRPGRTCGATMIDTGAPGLTVRGSGLAPMARDGAPARLVFGGGGGAPGMAIRLNERAQMTGYRLVGAPAGGGVAIFAGVTPYLAYDVLYDADRGTMAVRARPPFPGGPVAEGAGPGQ